MTVSLDGIDEDLIDDVELGLREQAIRAAQAYVPISELSVEERNRIEKVKSAELAISRIEKPKFNDRLDPLKSTLAPIKPLKRVAAVANANGLTPAKNPLTSILTPLAVNSGLGKKAKDSMDTSTDQVVDHNAMDTTTEQVEDPQDEFYDFINGTAQLDINKALLEHELASPQTDASMVDYLDRSDAQFTTNYEIGVKTAAPFPNLAREIMNLGLAMEKYHTENKLAVYKLQGDECKAKIDLLLKLSAQLPKMNSDDGSYELKEEAKIEIGRISEELRARGIDIFPGMEVGGEITKEQLASANSLVGHHIDVNRTNLQELFTTKISVSIQFLQMMTEVMKKVSDLDDRQKRKALELR